MRRRFNLKSLLTKYMLIVLAALVLLPITMPLSMLAIYLLSGIKLPLDSPYADGSKLQRLWHEEAARLGSSAEEVDAAVRNFLADYPEAGAFWVDADGTTRLRMLSVNAAAIPEVWNAGEAIQFMKERFGGDPFTVVAFIGADETNGFMVLEVPRRVMRRDNPAQKVNDLYYTAITVFVLVMFLTVSLMFFYRIRKRLVRLERAMGAQAANGIPARVEVQAHDEIGRLEAAFNRMIGQLEEGRAREREEEKLRRDLIAKLSHDLRTPLTTIQGHAHRLMREPMSDGGRESVERIMHKIGYLSRLIENLFSYSLLAAGKYPYRPDNVDITRIVREQIAVWYPAFEGDGFTIEADVPEESVMWTVDPVWLERVLDNYLQNVLRHAADGKYLEVRVTADRGGAIIIADRGPGMGYAGVAGRLQGAEREAGGLPGAEREAGGLRGVDHAAGGLPEQEIGQDQAAERGAGLGLSIAALMLKEMHLTADVHTGPGGTTIVIRRRMAPARDGSAPG